MPKYDKYKRKKKYIGKKKMKYTKKAKLGRPSQSLATSEYKFRRQMNHHYNFGNALPDQSWHVCTDADYCIYKTWEFTANADVTAWSEFQQLFQSYKLDSVRIQIYPDINNLTSQRLNPQMMLITIPTRHGFVPTTFAALKNHQALKKQIIFQNNQPVDLYMKLNQQTMVYSVNPNDPNNPYTDYVKTKPKYIATEEGDTVHYGLTTYIFTINQTALDKPDGWTPVACNIWNTMYFTCKGVA